MISTGEHLIFYYSPVNNFGESVRRPAQTKDFHVTATQTKKILPRFRRENHLEYYFAAKISFTNFSIKISKTVTES